MAIINEKLAAVVPVDVLNEVELKNFLRLTLDELTKLSERIEELETQVGITNDTTT